MLVAAVQVLSLVMPLPQPISTLFPYTTLFRSLEQVDRQRREDRVRRDASGRAARGPIDDDLVQPAVAPHVHPAMSFVQQRIQPLVQQRVHELRIGAGRRYRRYRKVTRRLPNEVQVA